MSRTKIAADIPAEATPEQRTEIVAGAYRTALSMASADVDIRLRMILGEANQFVEEIAVWVRAAIHKDDSKAPGLWAFAEFLARTETELMWLRRDGLKLDELNAVKALLLRLAVTRDDDGIALNG